MKKHEDRRRSKRTPAAGEFIEAVGDGCSIGDVAKTLSVSVHEATRNMQNLANLGLVEETQPGFWRKL